MTRSEQRLNKAIKMLEKEYARSQSLAFVNKPMAYALYQVWKHFDKNERRRRDLTAADQQKNSRKE